MGAYVSCGFPVNLSTDAETSQEYHIGADRFQLDGDVEDVMRKIYSQEKGAFCCAVASQAFVCVARLVVMNSFSDLFSAMTECQVKVSL